MHKICDIKEASAKKYVASTYLTFQIVNDKLVVVQTLELQMILHKLRFEGIQIDKQLQVAAIVDKLPPF